MTKSKIHSFFDGEIQFQSFCSFSRSRFKTALRLAVWTFHVSVSLIQLGTREINQFCEGD